MSFRLIWKTILWVFVIAIFVRVFFIDTFVVQGDSMSPIIKDGDYVVVNRLAYYFKEPNRGDIVVVRPRDTLKKIVKRVVGIPGDWLELNGSRIIAKEDRLGEGEILNEPYLNGRETTRENKEVFHETIDPYEYFVLGDNRNVSIDSRRLGSVDKWSIKGKVVRIFVPSALKLKSPYF